MKPTLPALVLAVLAAPAAAFPVTVQSCDRDITFDAPPQAAVPYDTGMVEMMVELDLTDHMVGYAAASRHENWTPKMTEALADLPEISGRNPSKEVLLGAGTDFFFAGWNYGMPVGGEVTPETLAPFGIQVYELTESCGQIMKKAPASMDDLYNDLLNLGTIFGVPDRAQALVDGYKAELADFIATLPPLDHAPRVFVYDSGEDVPFTAGRYAMPQALIEAAGGTNIMSDFEKSWGTVNWEPVIERNPEVIVIIDYGEVTAEQKRAFMMETPAFADIDAVRNDRFVVIDYISAVPSPRNVGAIKTLAEGFRAQ